MSEHIGIDIAIIGGGPAGQKAAIQAAKEGKSVLIIDKNQGVGGECVQRGTIPSKTLRETAVTLAALRMRTEGVLNVDLAPDLKVATLMKRLRSVLSGHQAYIRKQLERNGVRLLHGRAHLDSVGKISVEQPGGGTHVVEAGLIVVATGSRPRCPEWLAVDHEHILDSDSILSMIYLPRSLVVLGAGVIACEFASVMAALGVEVTIVDKHERPLGFLDGEITERFLASFERAGGTFLGNRETKSAEFDGISSVETCFKDGGCVRSEKVLCALGRVACIQGLGLKELGLEITKRGHLAVDDKFRTGIDSILGVGDVIGPPGLAATSMDQGQRAIRYALGLTNAGSADHVPIGIYTIPEMGCVGLTEAAAREKHGEILVGRAPFHELARGLITGNTDGMLKLIFDTTGSRLVGAHVVGEGATEIIHVAQMAIFAGLGLDAFLENTFNFPTLGEAYRVAALDVFGQLARRRQTNSENQPPTNESAKAA